MPPTRSRHQIEALIFIHTFDCKHGETWRLSGEFYSCIFAIYFWISSTQGMQLYWGEYILYYIILVLATWNCSLYKTKNTCFGLDAVHTCRNLYLFKLNTVPNVKVFTQTIWIQPWIKTNVVIFFIYKPVEIKYYTWNEY